MPLKDKITKIVYPKSNSYQSKDNFITKLFSNLIASILISDNAQTIIKNLDLTNLNRFDKYISVINEELIVKISEYNQGEGRISVCGDRINFDYQLFDNRGKLLKNEQDKNIILNESTDIIFFNLLNNKRQNSDYKIEFYDKEKKLHQIYKVKINQIKFLEQGKMTKRKNFSNIIINKYNGTRISCENNLKIQLSISESLEGRIKNLGDFYTDIYNRKIPRDFREILLSQRHGTEINLICDKKFVEDLVEFKFDKGMKQNLLILNIKIH